MLLSKRCLLTFGSDNSFNTNVVCFFFCANCWYPGKKTSVCLWFVSCNMHQSARLPLIAAITMSCCLTNHCSLFFSSLLFFLVCSMLMATGLVFRGFLCSWVRIKQAFVLLSWTLFLCKDQDNQDLIVSLWCCSELFSTGWVYKGY